MERWLLDTSALLTLRDDEPGAQQVADLLAAALDQSAGRTAAQERAGHQVAMDLCRHCLRDAPCQCFGGLGEDADDEAQRYRDAAAARQAMCSREDTEAFGRDSNARLDAWRAADQRDRGNGTAASGRAVGRG